MKEKMINYFKNVVNETAKLSTCQSKQVGALLVKDNRILSIGYNGVPSGQKHCNEIKFKDREEHHRWSELNEIHAEMNCIAFAAKNGIATKDTTLIVQLSPCINCAKLIVASEIKEVYYSEKYDKDKFGIEFLQNCGVKVYKL